MKTGENVPVADFTPEFKRTQDNDFDKLKLKLNEKARVVLLEKPTYAWVHTLRAPKIVNGQAVKEKKKRGGEEILDYALDFIGRPLCLGDNDVLASDAVDPKNCPVCAKAKESDEVAPPDRRFAVNVIRYGLQRDGNISDPFTCTCVVWAFTEGMYNKLYGIAQEYKNRGGLLGLDLILGPCQPPEAYQKFDIMAGSESVWKLDEKFTEIVTKTYQNNKVENLEAACGRKTELRWMKDDLVKISERWKTAHRGESVDTRDTGTTEQADLQAGLSSLLNTRPVSNTTAAGGSVDYVEPTPPHDPPSKEESDRAAQEQTETPAAAPQNFQSLLASLNLGS